VTGLVPIYILSFIVSIQGLSASSLTPSYVFALLFQMFTDGSSTITA